MSDWKALAEKELRGRQIEDIEWETLEGIRVKPLYTAEDTEGLPQMGEVPGFAPFTRGVKALDHSAIRRVLDGRGIERLLPAQPRRRSAGRVGRLRPGDAPGL